MLKRIKPDKIIGLTLVFLFGIFFTSCQKFKVGTPDENNDPNYNYKSFKSNQNRVALVIGNGAYSEAPLRNPVNDARLMGTILKKADFSVTILENARKNEMVNAIRNFGRSLKNSDAALFYFSGHGSQYKGLNWLLPIGTKVQLESDIEFEGLNAERVLSEMEGGSSKRVNIVIFDACRTNRTFRSFRSFNRGFTFPKVQPEGSIVAFSTAPGTVAYDGDGRYSPYVTELSKHMLTPGLKIEDVFKRVRVGVKSRTSRKPSPQIPWENSSLMGDFYFMFVDQAETSTESVSSYNELAGSENEEQLTEEHKPEVVVDPIAGWTWQKTPDGVKRNYDEAVKYCKNLSIDDFSDWKLPSVQYLKQVFKQKHILSSYKIDSSYWSTFILNYKKEKKEYSSQSSIVATVVNFRYSRVYPSIFLGEGLTPVRIKRRKFLDKAYDLKDHIASSWKYKRKDIQRELVKKVPDITKDELEYIFQLYGLDAESDPRNKHYVGCMHD